MTTWLITKNSTAADTNGGTSLAIRSTGTDGVVNATSGTTKISSVSAAGTWSAADIGHGIGSVTGTAKRLISAFTAGGVLGTITANNTTTITSTGLFSATQIGQVITGTGFAANTVITAVANANSATVSASVTAGTVTATLAPMFTTTGNVAFTAGTAQTWTVGGTWNTPTGALGASCPAVGGDTIYVGPGIYRGAVTISLTSPGSALNITGDVDGSHTGGVAGEVRFTSTSEWANGATIWTQTSKNNLSVSNICIYGIVGWTSITGCTFTDMAFLAPPGFSHTYTGIADTAQNNTWDRCIFIASTTPLSFTLPRSAIADYDSILLVRNSLFMALSSPGVVVTTNGAQTFKPGGVTLNACTIIASTLCVQTANTSISTTFPVNVYNCLLYSNGVALSATSAGQIVEDFNLFCGTSGRTNVTAGVHSYGTTNAIATMFSFGQERIWGGLPRPFFSLIGDTHPALGFGSTTSSPTPPSVDAFSRPRPGGVGRWYTNGTATSATSTTLTDSGASWGTNAYSQLMVRITGGTGSGQSKLIASNTKTALTMVSPWATTPDATSTYQIYTGAIGDATIATSASATTLVNSSAAWIASQWIGFTVEIVSGTGSGQITQVTANTATTLTVPTLGTTPDSTSKFKLYRLTSETTVNNSAGAFERHDTAEKETGTTDVGGVAIHLCGKAQHRFRIPVNASSTTISVRAQYDSNHGSTNKPTASIVANAEIGVTAETITMTAAVNTWETLTFTLQTPSRAGWVEVELASRGDAPYGEAYFDTFLVQ